MSRNIYSAGLFFCIACANGGRGVPDDGGKDATSGPGDAMARDGADAAVAEDDAGAEVPRDASLMDAPGDGGPRAMGEGGPDGGSIRERDGGPAGEHDGGPHDAGPLDAGPLDAGPLDAGPLDAGLSPDAGCMGDDARCDDGIACNGAERCVAGGCQAGAPVGCDDGLSCTLNRCTEPEGVCAFEPDDSLCPTPLTCDVSEGCQDASCDVDPCRITAPQCGCAEGSACSLSEAGARACLPSGDAEEGEACAASRCLPGLVCVDGSTASDTSLPYCARACDDDDDCIAGPGSFCVTTIRGSSPPQQICSADCDPVLGGCPEGTRCSIFEEDGTGRRLTDCQGPTGAGVQGAPCADDRGCAAGHECIDTGADGRRCLGWCRRARGSADCGAGENCVRLGEAPGLVFDGREYGVCL